MPPIGAARVILGLRSEVVGCSVQFLLLCVGFEGVGHCAGHCVIGKTIGPCFSKCVSGITDIKFIL